MKKFIAIAFLALFTTACTQTGSQHGMMQSGAMCEKSSCCQKMMEGGMMKDGKMQCPMMQGMSKDNKPCGCCGKMMGDGMMQNQSMPASKKPSGVNEEEHKQHHPAQ